MVLVKLGAWLITLSLGGLFAITLWHLIDAVTSNRTGRECRAAGVAACWLGCLAVIALAVATGSHRVALGAVVISPALAITSVALVATAPPAAGQSRGEAAARAVGDAWRAIGATSASIGGWAKTRNTAGRGRGPGPAGSSPPAGPGPGPSRGERTMPPPADDPGPGAGPGVQPAEVLNGVAIPPDHAAVAARVAGYEPPSNAEFGAFLHGEAAGDMARADSWELLADNLGEAGVGLDPAVTFAAYQIAQIRAEAAQEVLGVWSKYRQVYAVMEEEAERVRVPHQARQWFGQGNGAPLPPPGDGAGGRAA